MSFYYGKFDDFDKCDKCDRFDKFDDKRHGNCLLDCICGLLRSCLCQKPKRPPKPVVCDTVCRCKTICRPVCPPKHKHCCGFDDRDKCIY